MKQTIYYISMKTYIVLPSLPPTSIRTELFLEFASVPTCYSSGNLRINSLQIPPSLPPRRGMWHTPLHDSLTVNRQALSKTNTSTRVGVGLYSQIITPRVIFAATASLPGNPKTHPSDRGIQPMSDNKTKSSFFPCPGPFFVQGPNPPIEYSPPNS